MARKKDIFIKVTGLEELGISLDKFVPKMQHNLFLGFRRYVKKHLVPRMKKRLANATKARAKSNMGPGGIPTGGGGYGLPKNSPKYAEWKKSRSNLPFVGDLSTRELVATGHLVNSIDMVKFDKQVGGFMIEVGAKPGSRPSVLPFSNDPPGTATTYNNIENIKLAEWIEDSKYRFLVTEFEDVFRDAIALARHLINMTIKQLQKEYFSRK